MKMLCLAGAQIWPNFLPILGFQPHEVTFLTSHDPGGKYLQPLRSMQATAQEMGVPFQLEILSTISTEPSFAEVLELLADLPFDLVNLTGGTKPMSLAAFQHAGQRDISSFYLDTRRRTGAFEDLGTGPALIFPDLAPLSRKLTVSRALKAHGFPLKEKAGSPAEAQKIFGCQAASLRLDPEAEKSIQDGLSGLRSQFHDEKSKFHDKTKLRKALQSLTVPIPRTPWHQYLQAAAELELIHTEDGLNFQLTALDPVLTDTRTLHSAAKSAFNLLEGGWFEIAVFDHLQRLSPHSDLAWSVEADTSALGETDIIRFDPDRLQLHFISCKTTGPHGAALDHIQGLRQRASKEGGIHSKPELWIYRAKPGNHRMDLQSLCAAQGVALFEFTKL